MTDPTGQTDPVSDPPVDEQESVDNPAEESVDGLSPYRASLMEAMVAQNQEPNLVEKVYQSIGLQAPPGTTTQDTQLSLMHCRPGDLVGWHGGSGQDGSYQGNLAVYAGNGEIIEPFFQTTRRRKLSSNENVFGIPVVMQEKDTPIESNPMGDL